MNYPTTHSPRANIHTPDNAARQPRDEALERALYLILQVLQNTELRPERQTVIAVILAIVERDDAGWQAISLQRIADYAGVSRPTASRHLRRLDRWGVIERRIGRIETAPGQWISQQYLRLPRSPRETLEYLATFTPERESTWGGAR